MKHNTKKTAQPKTFKQFQKEASAAMRELTTLDRRFQPQDDPRFNPAASNVRQLLHSELSRLVDKKTACISCRMLAEAVMKQCPGDPRHDKTILKHLTKVADVLMVERWQDIVGELGQMHQRANVLQREAESYAMARRNRIQFQPIPDSRIPF
jgi:hypothetical protein